jgi:hypothetical protein
MIVSTTTLYITTVMLRVNAQCHYMMICVIILNVMMLSVIILSIMMFSVIILNVMMFSVIILNVIMLSFTFNSSSC